MPRAHISICEIIGRIVKWPPPFSLGRIQKLNNATCMKHGPVKQRLSHPLSRIKSIDQWAVDPDPFLTLTTSAKIGKTAIAGARRSSAPRTCGHSYVAAVMQPRGSILMSALNSGSGQPKSHYSLWNAFPRGGCLDACNLADRWNLGAPLVTSAVARKDASTGSPPSLPDSSPSSAAADCGKLCFKCRKPSTGPGLLERHPVKNNVKPFTLPPLPRDWDKMLDAVQDSWEKGLNGGPALKTFVSGSTKRAAMASNKEPLGRVSSSMLSKRGAIAKAATNSGGWSALRSVLVRERDFRKRTGTAFPCNEVYKFCATLVSKADLCP